MNLDQLLEKRVKNGLFQSLVFFRVCYLDIFQGIDLTFTSIMIQILRKEFNLTFPYDTNLSSSYTSGVVFGNFICAYIANSIGRKVIIMGSSLLAFLSQLFISFSQFYQQIILFRFLLGLSIGGVAPLPAIILTEVIEVRFKQKFVYCLSFAYLTGKLYFIFLCYIFLNNFDEGNWRGLMIASSLPLFLQFLSSITLEETSSYLLRQERFEEAFDQIRLECQMNSQPDYLPLEEQEDIKSFIYQLNEKKSKDGIFSPKYAIRTIQLWLILLICNNQIIAINILLPILLNQSNQTFKEFLIIASFEGLFIFIIFQTLEYQFWTAKRDVLLITSILTIFINAYMYIYREDSIILGSIFTLIFARCSLTMTLALTGSSYDTGIRDTALAQLLGAGKIGSIFSAPIFIYLNGIDPYLPFWYLGLLAIIQLLIVWTLKEI